MSEPLLDSLLVPEHVTLREAIAALERNHQGVILVTDANRRALGLLTDGDVRRLVLRNVPLDAPAREHVNANFMFWPVGSPREGAVAVMRQRHLRHLPVLDAEGRVVDVVCLDQINYQTFDNEVVIMAGGLGTRLRPYTERCPKPMLEVAGKPMLEHILEGLLGQGFSRFCLCVNYLGDQIANHFGDGRRWGASIRYVREPRRLGTAGALGLLDPAPTRPFLVVNGDVLTRVSYRQFLEFHERHRAAATVAVRGYEIQLPYAVVEVQDQRVTALVEKPVKAYLVNAGIYCLSPEVLALVPCGEPLDMPDLLERARQAGHTVVAFPVHEDWLDVGRPDDYRTAQTRFGEAAPSAASPGHTSGQ
jgi:dTDP-glucose pyrophosphorylase